MTFFLPQRCLKKTLKRGERNNMWTIIFFITTVTCAMGWLGRYISCTAMIYYLAKKQYKLPDDEEIKECTVFVVKHMFRDLFK